ncbi:hypothetical protein PVAND_012278 [Polypedilum vanderplanki]|uniref:Uncharacterized protein n=1 Tax=Polypedilum vanderplanki TaxID=319348 RepID=A0A9J6CL37_POLVA|nr:hypothetical protein PVAND_012278 [Polypedilum vanderplanki]
MEDFHIPEVEDELSKWMVGLRRNEDLASIISSNVQELEMEIKIRNDMKANLDEHFNIERDDFGIYHNIQRDYQTEAYIKELENTLEIVMNKYREHTQKQIEATKLEFNKLKENANECTYKMKIENQEKIINNMIKMMKDFLKEGNLHSNELLAENARLKAENDYLRKLINFPEISDNLNNTVKKAEDTE